MRQLNKKMRLFLKIKPQLVRIPLLMMGVSALGVVTALISIRYNIEIFRNLVYTLYVLLFIITPWSTFALVLKKFRHNKKRRNNIIIRMIITTLPAVYFILSDSFCGNANLLIFGSGGIIYFLHDYFKQGKIALILERNPSKIINNHKFFTQALETNCSRRVIIDWSKTLDQRDARIIKLRVLREGYRFYHLFPVSEESLTQQLLLARTI